MRARPTRPFPSANGWMVSNCAWAMAAWTTGGRSVRFMNATRSSMRSFTRSGAGGTKSARPGLYGVAANPVLVLAELAGNLGRGRREHQVAMDLEDVLEPEGLRAGAEGDGVLHGDDVAEDGPGGLVARIGLLGLRSREAPLREDKAFDPGGRDRLGAEQPAGEDLEAGQARRVAVQGVDGALGDRDRGGDARRQRELEAGDWVGDEGAVAERAALRSAAGSGRIGGPGAGLVPSHRNESFTNGSER